MGIGLHALVCLTPRNLTRLLDTPSHFEFVARLDLAKMFGFRFLYNTEESAADFTYLTRLPRQELRQRLYEVDQRGVGWAGWASRWPLFPIRPCHILLSARSLYRVHFIVFDRDRMYVGVSDLTVIIHSARIEEQFCKLGSFVTSRSARSLSASPSGSYVCVLTGKPLAQVEIYCVADPSAPQRLTFQFVPYDFLLQAPFAFHPWTGPDTLLVIKVPFTDCRHSFRGEEWSLCSDGEGVVYSETQLLKKDLLDPLDSWLLESVLTLDVALPRQSRSLSSEYTLVAALECLNLCSCPPHFVVLFRVGGQRVLDRHAYSFSGQVLDIKSDQHRFTGVFYIPSTLSPPWASVDSSPLSLQEIQKVVFATTTPTSSPLTPSACCVNRSDFHCNRAPLPYVSSRRPSRRRRPATGLSASLERGCEYRVALIDSESGSVTRLVRLREEPAWASRLRTDQDVFAIRTLIHHTWTFDSSFIVGSFSVARTHFECVWDGSNEAVSTLCHDARAGAAVALSRFYFALVTFPDKKLTLTLYRRRTVGRNASLLVLAHAGAYHHTNDLARCERAEVMQGGERRFGTADDDDDDDGDALDGFHSPPPPTWFPGHRFLQVVRREAIEADEESRSRSSSRASDDDDDDDDNDSDNDDDLSPERKRKRVVCEEVSAEEESPPSLPSPSLLACSESLPSPVPSSSSSLSPHRWPPRTPPPVQSNHFLRKPDQIVREADMSSERDLDDRYDGFSPPLLSLVAPSVLARRDLCPETDDILEDVWDHCVEGEDDEVADYLEQPEPHYRRGEKKKRLHCCWFIF
jgi:hypothetical protein